MERGFSSPHCSRTTLLDDWRNTTLASIEERPMATRFRLIVSLAAALSFVTAAGRAWAQSSGPLGVEMPVHRVSTGRFKVSVAEAGILEASVALTVQCKVEGQAAIIKILPEGTNA